MEKKKQVSKTPKKTTKKITKKVTTKKVEKKIKKKKGFTLIELLAVIIILGILMIIAIPSVTRYISDSRKSVYVDTAKEIIVGARNKVNDGKLGMFDTDATYYIPASYIKTENASKSPYGEFTEAYVVITYNGKGYNYYWTSVDDAGEGIKEIIAYDKLETDDVESDLTDDMINPNITKRGVGERSKILILDPSTETWKEVVGGATTKVPEEGGSEGNIDSNIICKRVMNQDELHTGNTNIGGRQYNLIYGNIWDGKNSIPIGAAFDCDVNGDGSYSERFYYLSDYYDTELKNYNHDYAVLIYYNNISNGVANNDSTCAYYLDLYSNYQGPITAALQLPTKSQWSNVELYKSNRQLITKSNENNYNYGSSTYNLVIFDYSNYVARLPIYQEIVPNCGESDYYENHCSFLVENDTTHGYWIDTPSTITSYDVLGVNFVGKLSSNYSKKTGQYGVRPVIEVEKSKLG